MSQIDTLKRHFKITYRINDMEARSMYKIRALPRRIKDMEELGYLFTRQRKVDPTGQRYVEYVLNRPAHAYQKELESFERLRRDAG